MHKPKYRTDTRYSKTNLSLLMPFSSYSPLPTLCTQLQGFVHIATDSTRPPCTQLQCLYILLQPKTRTYRLRSNTAFRHPCYFAHHKNLPSTLRAWLLFIHSHGPRTMYRLTHSRLIYNILGWTTLRLDPLQFVLCELRGAFTMPIPKNVGFTPQKRYAGDPLPNIHPLSLHISINFLPLHHIIGTPLLFLY